MEELSTVRGAWVTAVQRRDDFALFATDLAGAIYANAGAPGKTWWGWGSVSQGKSTPGAPVTAVPWSNRIAVFVAGTDGGVYNAAGDPQTGWGPWASVSQGSTVPGAPVTAVPWGNRIAVFVADRDGGVYNAAGDPQTGWGPWASVSQGSTMPGAPVAAVPWGNRIAVFVADRGGGIFCAAGDPETGWGPWASVSQGSTMPGARVTAIAWGNRIALFIADRGGGVFTTAGDPQNGWGPWASVSQGSTTPGAPVTAAHWNNRIALFLADPNGGVYNAAGDPQAGFGPWASVSQGSTMPGAPVSAVASGNRTAVFLADRAGGIFSTAGDPQTGWESWTSPLQFPPAPAAYQLGVLPQDPTPTIPEGDDIILYLHGGPGSRLEEASDLVPQLHISGRTRGKRYTVIAFDQPSQGYSSMLGPDQIVQSHDLVGDKYPTLVFSEDFIVAFVEALHKIVPIKHRNIYIIGGSTGGALALRMGHRSEDWIKRIVAWSCACVWTTYANDVLKGAALHSGFARSEHGEDGGRRGEFFDNTFGPIDPGPVADLVTGIIQPNPVEWYRGDRDSAIKEWPCKWDYIASARLDYEEVYNWRFRRWHWRMGTEELLFSFFNDSWQGPANTAADKERANYWQITKPTLLAAGEDDNWDEGNGQHWENRWDRTWEIARLMANTPGYTLLLPYTGHSIHNERPILFAKQITAFLSDPHWDTATGPLQPPYLFPKSQMLEEDQNCNSQLSKYPRPPEELLAIPESTTTLTQPAPPSGTFLEVIGDPRHPIKVITHSPGTYGLRLKQELRDVAAQCNPVIALGHAAARYYLGDPIWGAFADLAVTGRLSYEALRNEPPKDEAIIVIARAVLKAPSLFSLDENKLADCVLTAKTRAYKVAWVLRDPDREEGYRLRPAWGWIAVSGEDDSPARPVNVASGLPILGPDEKTQVSTHPQYEIGVQMLPSLYYNPVSFQIRYSIASPPSP